MSEQPKKLPDYHTKLDADGRMDYQLVSVHVPNSPVLTGLDRKIRQIGEETVRRFSHAPLELHPDNMRGSNEPALFEDIGTVTKSSRGEITDTSLVLSRNVVLVGQHVARCHAGAFNSLIGIPSGEIHIPIDAVGSVDDVLFSDFDHEGQRRIVRAFYARGMLENSDARLTVHYESQDGTMETIREEEDGVLVVLHQTWDSLDRFLAEHKL